MGIFVKFWHFFTMPAHQIWSYHMSQEANLENFYFFLILHLILGKVTKFLVEKLSTSEIISQKSHRGGVENTPPQCRRVNGQQTCESLSLLGALTFLFKQHIS